MSTRYQLTIRRITDPTPEEFDKAVESRSHLRPVYNDNGRYEGSRAGELFPIQDVLAVEVTEEQYKAIKAESLKAF